MIRATVRRRVAAALTLVIAVAGLAGTSGPVSAGSGCNVKNVTDATSFGGVQAAVDAASNGDKIEIRGACVGPVQVYRHITLVGKTVGGTMATIYGQESVRPMEIIFGWTVTIKNLEISSGFSVDDGGGILNEGTLTLTDVVVFENDAQNGGGISNIGTLVINGASRIRNNRAVHGGGGISSRGSLTIGGTTVVADNDAEFGGGIAQLGFEGRRRPLVVRDKAVVRGNTGWTGFGIHVEGTSVVLRDKASVRGNQSDGGEGDAAVYLDGGRLTMLGSASVRGNTGVWAGGIMGAAFEGPSSVTMKGSSVVKANRGFTAGIYMEDGSILMIDSSSVRGHTAEGINSAITVQRRNGTASLTMKESSRVIDNDVADGWGAVTRAWCEGPKATLSGLSSRVIRNKPVNVKTLCP
jgi:predicted outer membrane repeat protein